ncbi:DUF1510 family protein [Priestia megaterium]|nr:DUF1510 family protein [Priestia megaterium]
MNNSRFSRHENKEKKVNRLYNVLIAVVAVLIVFIGGSLMLGDSEEKSPKQATENTPKTEDKTIDETAQKENESVVKDSSDKEKSIDEEVEQEESSELQVEENPEQGVETRTVDPSWEPAGTSQGEKPASSYKKGSTDWNEMLAAVSAGSGVDVNNMTVWRLENNGGPEQAVATISSKSDKTKYRVEIEWVDNEGWKPTVVEKLAQ